MNKQKQTKTISVGSLKVRQIPKVFDIGKYLHPNRYLRLKWEPAQLRWPTSFLQQGKRH